MRLGCVMWVALLLVSSGCQTRVTKGLPAATTSTGGGVSYVCGGAHDYRAFEGSAALADINALAPRREQTRSQAESLTPGDPLWELSKPEIRCSEGGFLELRYSVSNAGGFQDAPHRLTVTIAPGARLLDPQAHSRMSELAAALDESLSQLRTKSCSERGEPCDLRRNPDPLRFPGTRIQYAVSSEFKQIGRRAWSWRFASGERQVERVLFCTTDGRFDIEVLLETRDSENGTGTLSLLPELLSDEYDKRPRPTGSGTTGGSHG
jgi:hypothetical protein